MEEFPSTDPKGGKNQTHLFFCQPGVSDGVVESLVGISHMSGLISYANSTVS